MTEDGAVERGLRNIRDASFTLGEEIRRALDFPPSPVAARFLAQMDGTPILIVRQHWTQPTSPVEAYSDDTTVPNGATREQHDAASLIAVARQVTRLANPLRELANTLTAMADDCDARMIIPVGVALLSRHSTESNMFQRHLRDFEQAEVQVSVTTIAAEWVRATSGKQIIGEETGDARDGG